jgi:SAM-dependent methyltransferase
VDALLAPANPELITLAHPKEFSRVTNSNVNYWRAIHRTYPAQLRAVGHPWLSDAFNRLKYDSEAETLLMVLARCLKTFSSERPLTFLDVGSGSGYWTHMVSQWLRDNRKNVETTALDLSEDALGNLKQRLPWVETLCFDLKAVSPDRFEGKFDLVTAFYCLHHLIRMHDFLNALAFCARSVKMSGFLLIMDPLLHRRYSPFDAFDFGAWSGNGIPRHLYLLDDLLIGYGFARLQMTPAVSFLLNGPIESNGWLRYLLLEGIWHVLQKIGASQDLTLKIAKKLMRWDRCLKRRHLSFSSSLCLYQKTTI